MWKLSIALSIQPQNNTTFYYKSITDLSQVNYSFGFIDCSVYIVQWPTKHELYLDDNATATLNNWQQLK